MSIAQGILEKYGFIPYASCIEIKEFPTTLIIETGLEVGEKLTIIDTLDRDISDKIAKEFGIAPPLMSEFMYKGVAE
jgi:hypothetical protein